MNRLRLAVAHINSWRRAGVAVVLGLVVTSAAAQAPAADTLARSPLLVRSSLIAVPIVYYTPETRLAGGGAALYTFRLRGQSAAHRPSQLQLGAAYTQERQLLLYLPFQVFWQEQRWQTFGELGYYRYVYQFLGIGNRTEVAARESYDVVFPRLRFSLLRQVAPHQYLGLRAAWDHYRMQRLEPGGQLAAGDIVGASGGVVAGAGLVYLFDSRNDLFYPTRGILAEVELVTYGRALGSRFGFSRWSVDVATYHAHTPRRVLALNAWVASLYGQVPFQQLALLGGPKKMRGYFEGRLRDKNLWTLQAEYRWLLGRSRWGATAFGGLGAVADTLGQLFGARVHLTAGGGLRYRLSRKDHINLRLDVGLNEMGEMFPYLTVREAF